MQIVVNGNPREVALGLSVFELLAQLEAPAEHVAVECNGEVLEREDFATRNLKSQDRLEIVRFVGGG